MKRHFFGSHNMGLNIDLAVLPFSTLQDNALAKKKKTELRSFFSTVSKQIVFELLKIASAKVTETHISLSKQKSGIFRTSAAKDDTNSRWH